MPINTNHSRLPKNPLPDVFYAMGAIATKTATHEFDVHSDKREARDEAAFCAIMDMLRGATSMGSGVYNSVAVLDRVHTELGTWIGKGT